MRGRTLLHLARFTGCKLQVQTPPTVEPQKILTQSGEAFLTLPPNAQGAFKKVSEQGRGRLVPEKRKVEEKHGDGAVPPILELALRTRCSRIRGLDATTFCVICHANHSME